jgi:hypothetical protein
MAIFRLTLILGEINMSKALDDKDLEILNKNISLREKIVEELSKQEGAFTDSRKVRILLEALDSTDNTIIQKSKIKVEEEKNKNDSEIKQALVMSLREAHLRRQQNRVAATQRTTELDDSVSFDVKPTELILHDEPRSLEDFNAKYSKEE